MPLFYLPYLRHPVDETGRESGFLIPVVSTGSSIRGYTFGEQVYWVISRNMDMIAGTEYYSKRGWAPNGDFRYKGPGLDHADRALECPAGPRHRTDRHRHLHAARLRRTLVNQGGVDINALGRKDLSPETRLAGNVEYLSSYLYRLVFNDNYWLAVSSEVQSDLSLTHAHNGFVPSALTGPLSDLCRHHQQQRGLHQRQPGEDSPSAQPALRCAGPAAGRLGTLCGAGFVARLSEPLRARRPIPTGTSFHARNVGRLDFYPHLSLPLAGGGWSLVSEAALRETAYTISQTPDLTGANGGTPTISHDPLNRADFEASVDLRPPALERDFTLTRWNRQLRHVIEPEFTYRYVTGIGAQARKVLLIDTTDIATNTNEVGYSLTQRFYLRPAGEKPCAGQEAAAPARLPGSSRASGPVGRLRRSSSSTPTSAGR